VFCYNALVSKLIDSRLLVAPVQCCGAQNVHSLSIGDLLEGVTYLVHVQALSRSGAGRVASIHFTTPLLQLVPVGRSCVMSVVTCSNDVVTIRELFTSPIRGVQPPKFSRHP